MPRNDIEITVDVKLEVSKQTAEACLKLVEAYLNAHSGIDLIAHKEPDGTLQLEFQNR